MIISFNGDHASGKSTIAKRVAQTLNYPHFYMGQIFRDMAKERDMTVEEFDKICRTDPSFDKQLDDYVIKLAEKNNNFAIESRTAWHFIPESIKIYLKVSDREAAKRVFKELSNENRKNESKNFDSDDKIFESLKNRKKNDDARYMKHYGLDIRKESNYDFILDTTHLSIEDVFRKVIAFINLKSSKKGVDKTS